MSRLESFLVVEDNPHDASLLQYAAEKAPSGLAFHFVGSGEEAIAYLEGKDGFADRRAHPLPKLVLLDLSLPGMSGVEVLSWIRRHPLLNELRVFVWTDAGEPEVIARATRAGANTFVPKSVSFVQGGLAGLIGDIARALDGATTSGNVRAAR